jgi:2-dehydro-3-deoxygluconokinase
MISPSARAATSELLDRAAQAGSAISVDPKIRRQLGPPEQWASVVGPLLEQATMVYHQVP